MRALLMRTGELNRGAVAYENALLGNQQTVLLLRYILTVTKTNIWRTVKDLEVGSTGRKDQLLYNKKEISIEHYSFLKNEGADKASKQIF
jgi:hypothetical protein